LAEIPDQGTGCHTGLPPDRFVWTIRGLVPSAFAMNRLPIAARDGVNRSRPRAGYLARFQPSDG
jgi:hypothetical protein